MKLSFEKISLQHIDIIFGWLAEPFVQEFWDNTQQKIRIREIESWFYDMEIIL